MPETDIPAGPSNPEIPQPGQYRIPLLNVYSTDFGLTLTIWIQDGTGAGSPAGSYRVYYISPLDVSEAAITLDFSTAILSAQFVTDMSADVTNKVTIVATPIGTDGGRRDYSLGGWMYAVPILANGQPDSFSMTNLVRVPTFDKFTNPPDKVISSASLTTTGPVDNIYTVKVKFINPTPQFGRTVYAQVWMFNYFNDAAFRCMGIYRLHGAPNDPNGQVVTYQLEKDGGGHNVSFFIGHCNGQRAMPFAVSISTFVSATQVGGFP